MNEHLLLDLATDLGYELAISGAETYRVEDSARLVLTAYGLSPEVAATNNYLIVSILSADRTPITRMRRIGFHGNNLDAVERLNALSRRLCAETPAPEIAAKMLEETRASVPYYSFPVVILGHFLGAGGFGLLFGCRPTDALLAGLGGILIAFVNRFASAMKTNPIFSTLAASFLMSLLAYGLGAAGIAANADTVIIGGMMILVPGLVFTNALRDMIYGDISSGIHKCVQVLLIAGSMALGSAAARNLTIQLWGPPEIAGTAAHSLGLLCFGAFLGCTGFSILFNIHGPGMLLCTRNRLLCGHSFFRPVFRNHGPGPEVPDHLLPGGFYHSPDPRGKPVLYHAAGRGRCHGPLCLPGAVHRRGHRHYGRQHHPDLQSGSDVSGKA